MDIVKMLKYFLESDRESISRKTIVFNALFSIDSRTLMLEETNEFP